MLNIKRGLQCSMLVGFKNAERFTVQYLGWCWICGEVYSAVFWLALNIQRSITVQQFGRCWKCGEVYSAVFWLALNIQRGITVQQFGRYWKCGEVYSAEFWKALKMRKGFTVQYFGVESAERFTVQYFGWRWIYREGLQCSILVGVEYAEKVYSAVFR